MKLQRFIEQIVQDNSGGMEMTEVHVHIISALQHAKISDFKYSRAKNWGTKLQDAVYQAIIESRKLEILEYTWRDGQQLRAKQFVYTP